MGERVAGIGIDRAHGGLTGGEVVRMAGEDEVPTALGRRGQHPLGFHLADDPADVASQFDRRLQPAVGVAEEMQIASRRLPPPRRAARCWRSAAMSDRDIERSDPPASPLVAMQ